MPVLGTVLVTTAIFKMVCKPTCAVRPTAMRQPNLSLARRAITNPRHSKRANRMMMIAAPMSPSSSQTMEKMKSF